MRENQKKQSIHEKIRNVGAGVLGVVSSPSTTLEITLDIRKTSEGSRALGQMVFVQLEEDDQFILSLGQVVEVVTKNRWHEDASFKGVIKHHGKLPHLSGDADNRIATISVQSSFEISGPKPNVYLLGMSPSTGGEVEIVNNDLMQLLVEHQKDAITYLGKVYGTSVDLPMWFKHFGSDEQIPDLGAKDAFHIGVFGKTGSGKSVTSALMLLAYAKNHRHMNVLVLDPQGQFYKDQIGELLPGEQTATLSQEIENITRKEVIRFKLIEDVSIPEEEFHIFGELLANNGFIDDAFGRFYNDDKTERMQESIISYIEGRKNKPSFKIGSADPRVLLSEMTENFLKRPDPNSGKSFSQAITNVYGTESTRQRLFDKIQSLQKALGGNNDPPPYFKKWEQTLGMFSQNRQTNISNICKIITGKEGGNFIVLDLSPSAGEIENDNLQALFLRLIEKGIVEEGGNLYADGKHANCLIVMDEAHRFISNNSPDTRIKELTREIVDAVRTTRKYGIGHMFITQSLESLDDEIIKQMRIFAFGHGLTMGAELRKVREIVNNQAAVNLYASFIDPANSRKFPFMFFGPVSPFSATGSPLFIDIYTNYQNYKKKNKNNT